MSILRKIGKTSSAPPEEVLVLDTNVLLWTFYSKLTPKKHYQTQAYPSFVATAIAQKNQIIVTTFCLNEMLHVIEKTEYELYKTKMQSNLSLKEYRKKSSERCKVKTEIELILKQLRAIPTLQIIKNKATQETINQFVNSYNVHLADFFDFCLISFCNNNKYAIVTDDCDFNTSFYRGVLYSANPNI